MRALAVRQLLAAAAVVLVLALAGGGRYPLPVDLAVYAAGAAMAATGVGQIHAARARRHSPHPADRPDHQDHQAAVTEAVDWVITARPAHDYAGRTLTPQMVQEEARMRSGLTLTPEEAARALHERLIFRGYRAPN